LLHDSATLQASGIVSYATLILADGALKGGSRRVPVYHDTFANEDDSDDAYINADKVAVEH